MRTNRSSCHCQGRPPESSHTRATAHRRGRRRRPGASCAGRYSWSNRRVVHRLAKWRGYPHSSFAGSSVAMVSEPRSRVAQNNARASRTRHKISERAACRVTERCPSTAGTSRQPSQWAVRRAGRFVEGDRPRFMSNRRGDESYPARSRGAEPRHFGAHGEPFGSACRRECLRRNSLSPHVPRLHASPPKTAGLVNPGGGQGTKTLKPWLRSVRVRPVHTTAPPSSGTTRSRAHQRDRVWLYTTRRRLSGDHGNRPDVESGTTRSAGPDWHQPRSRGVRPVNRAGCTPTIAVG
jgi:hypothetical protein